MPVGCRTAPARQSRRVWHIEAGAQRRGGLQQPACSSGPSDSLLSGAPPSAPKPASIPLELFYRIFWRQPRPVILRVRLPSSQCLPAALLLQALLCLLALCLATSAEASGYGYYGGHRRLSEFPSSGRHMLSVSANLSLDAPEVAIPPTTWKHPVAAATLLQSAGCHDNQISDCPVRARLPARPSWRAAYAAIPPLATCHLILIPSSSPSPALFKPQYYGGYGGSHRKLFSAYYGYGSGRRLQEASPMVVRPLFGNTFMPAGEIPVPQFLTRQLQGAGRALSSYYVSEAVECQGRMEAGS